MPTLPNGSTISSGREAGGGTGVGVALRGGEGTKLVLTGDPTQIDNPYLDGSGNGPSYLVERLKGRGIVGHVTLAASERSELASLVAAEL